MDNCSSRSSIMTIREMIDAAFGDTDMNIVNHKLMQTVLYLLARQLRVLERRVEIEIGPAMQISPSTSLSATEIKLHAMQKKKTKTAKVISGGKEGVKTVAKTGGTAGVGVGAIAAKTPGKELFEKEGLSTAQSGSRQIITSSATAQESVTIDTTYSDKFRDKTSSDKSSSTKSTSDKTPTEKSTEKSTDKSSTDKSKSSSDKTSTENSTDKTFNDITSTEKSTNKSSTEKSSTEQSFIEKSTEKTSSEKSTDQTSAKKTTHKSPALTATGITSSSKRTSSDTGDRVKKTSQDYRRYLEKIETEREKELRIIHQRANSREEQEESPTPMASIDSVEAQYEKLIIVERLPVEDTKANASRKSSGQTPKLSVVTQDQFAALSAAVQEVQAKFAPIGISSFPENLQLMQDLRKGASLTDAMAALQLAARLEAAEKTLNQMLSLFTELATKLPGVNIADFLNTEATGGVNTQIIFGAKAGTPSRTSAKQPSSMLPKSTQPQPPQDTSPRPSSSEESVHLHFPTQLAVEPDYGPSTNYEPSTDEKAKIKLDSVTYEELDNALQELFDEIMKSVQGITSRNATNADNAFKIASRLEGRLEASLNLGSRMNDLEVLVSDYADQINILDTGLSSQMTNYQEQLTQMQHDLETGLETMAETFANAGGDTTAIAELNSQFSNLQQDLDNTALRQKELKIMQNAFSLDLEVLCKQLELLRDTKSDREEVADALRDKAGIGALNGLVSVQQFDAVRGDFEKRIGAAYDKFNNQEMVWQKAIDDLLRELNEKADWIQVVSLRDEINKYLDILKSRIQAMFEIVGEPRAAAISRKLQRDTMCLSCSTAAHMDLEEPGIVPALPAFQASRPPTIGAEVLQPREDGDHGLCYPGQPVSHPRDPRSHVCQRYCGGSHTLVNNNLNRLSAGIIVNPALRKINTELGTDGKVYRTDKLQPKIPCLPCNIPKTTTPAASVVELIPEQGEIHSDMSPSDFRPASDLVFLPNFDGVSVTPPAWDEN